MVSFLSVVPLSSVFIMHDRRRPASLRLWRGTGVSISTVRRRRTSTTPVARASHFVSLMREKQAARRCADKFELSNRFSIGQWLERELWKRPSAETLHHPARRPPWSRAPSRSDGEREAVGGAAHATSVLLQVLLELGERDRLVVMHGQVRQIERPHVEGEAFLDGLLYAVVHIG